MALIAISGKIGSGKDTVGKIIQYLIARKGDQRNIKILTSEDTLLKMKKSALDKEKVLCEHCNNEVTPHNFKRWHGENCDYKNVPEGFKKCSDCKSVLKKENFNKNKRQLDGFNRQCKKCKSEINKNNYKNLKQL